MQETDEKDPLDTTIIEALIAEIGPESMARVLDAMAGDADRLLQGLEQAMDRGDAKAFSLFAHSLKSNSLTVGAVAVGELFDQLEALCTDEVVGASKEAVQHAQTQYRTLIGFIVTVPDTESQNRISSVG